MEPERSLGDMEMLSNRQRGNDWDSAEGRKEEEGRAPLTADETWNKSQEEGVAFQLEANWAQGVSFCTRQAPR